METTIRLLAKKNGFAVQELNNSERQGLRLPQQSEAYSAFYRSGYVLINGHKSKFILGFKIARRGGEIKISGGLRLLHPPGA